MVGQTSFLVYHCCSNCNCNCKLERSAKHPYAESFDCEEFRQSFIPISSNRTLEKKFGLHIMGIILNGSNSVKESPEKLKFYHGIFNASQVV